MTQVKGLVDAFDAFIVGCKSDGIWDAIKACCILAGWDGLNGCLIPLKGAAPTNNNFVSGDYSRTAGLTGDGATKSLNSNRAGNADPQDDTHLSVYLTSTFETSFFGYAGAGLLYRLIGSLGTGNGFGAAANAGYIKVGSGTTFPSLISFSRSSSANFNWRGLGQSGTASSTSTGQETSNTNVFAYGSARTASTLAFYSIGESLDLALLDTRVTNLITAIGAAIP